MRCLRLLFHERPHRSVLLDLSVVQEIIHLGGFFSAMATLSSFVSVRGRRLPLLDLAPVGLLSGPAQRLVVLEIDHRLHAVPVYDACEADSGAGTPIDIRSLIQSAA